MEKWVERKANGLGKIPGEANPLHGLNGAQRLNGLNVLNIRPNGAKGVNDVDHPR